MLLTKLNLFCLLIESERCVTFLSLPTLGGRCRIRPNFGIIVSQGIGTPKERERGGEQLVNGAVRTHEFIN